MYEGLTWWVLRLGRARPYPESLSPFLFMLLQALLLLLLLPSHSTCFIPTSASEGVIERLDKAREVRNWAMRKGTFVHESIVLEQAGPTSGIRWVARNHMLPGQILLELPSVFVEELQSAVSGAAQTLEQQRPAGELELTLEEEEEEEQKEEEEQGHSCRTDVRTFALADWIVLCARDPECFAQTWLRSWPSAEFNLFSWPDEQLRVMADHSIATAARDRHDAVIQHHSLTFAHSKVSVEAYQWAVSQVLSRSFDVNHGRLTSRILVPLVDFFNHCDDPGAARAEIQAINDSHFVVRLVTPSPIGAEVCLEYISPQDLHGIGSTTGAHFLMQYGFVPKWTPKHTFDWRQQPVLVSLPESETCHLSSAGERLLETLRDNELVQFSAPSMVSTFGRGFQITSSLCNANFSKELDVHLHMAALAQRLHSEAEIGSTNIMDEGVFISACHHGISEIIISTELASRRKAIVGLGFSKKERGRKRKRKRKMKRKRTAKQEPRHWRDQWLRRLLLMEIHVLKQVKSNIRT